MAKLSLSLFAADILQMNEELQQTKRSEITSFHVDIMDGHFVPLFGLNPVWLKQIKKVYSIDQDFHFMAYMTKALFFTGTGRNHHSSGSREEKRKSGNTSANKRKRYTCRNCHITGK